MKVKPKKVTPEAMAQLQEGLEIIKKGLQIQCGKCNGTGKPKTKLGKPPKELTGNVNCNECGGEGVLGSRLLQMEHNIEKMKKELSRIKSSLTTHINKHTVEIRVLPEGHNPKLHGYNVSPTDYSKYTAKQTEALKWKNGWVDYSGKFDLDDQEEMSIVIGKARLHFETYFQDAVYHRNRKFGMFLTSGSTSGKRLIEEMETGE